MNLRTRLSHSNGYRELGMFDESILELEAIEFGEDRWHPLVIEAPLIRLKFCQFVLQEITGMKYALSH